MGATTILFVGDSLVEFYDWRSHFSKQNLLNRGRAGETVEELLERLPSELKRANDADIVSIMIGTNNIAMEDFAFLPDYEEILDTVRASLPNAQIIVNGLFPLLLPWLSGDAVSRINEMLMALAERKGAQYLDCCAIFKGQEQLGFLEDGVHLSDYGYKLWTEALSGYFDPSSSV